MEDEKLYDDAKEEEDDHQSHSVEDEQLVVLDIVTAQIVLAHG